MCITFSCLESSVYSSKIVWLTSMVSDPCLWWGRVPSGTLLFLSGNAIKFTDVSEDMGAVEADIDAVNSRYLVS